MLKSGGNMKRFCQACAREIHVDANRCPNCGSIQSSSGISIRKKQSGTSSKRMVLILLCGLIGGGAVIGLYWIFKVKPRLQGLGVIAPDGKEIRKTLKIEEETGGSFDRKAALPVEPLGFTFGRSEYVLGSRNNPPGFVRLKLDEEGSAFKLATVPVHESRYSQRISFNTVAWNGKEYVTVTNGAWFGSSSKDVFCKHHPESYEILSTTPAPDQLGCLAFDGNNYWGATRANTKTSGEPVFIYRFDSDFSEISRHPARAKGCQGMAWDGQYLWMVDVFNDSIYVLDIYGSEPAIVETIPTNFSYLSGIAFDGRDIWVSEYENHQIHRLSPALKTRIASSGPPPVTPSIIDASYSETKLQDAYTNNSPEYPEEDADVHEFSAEIVDGTIYASWKIHFGERLFNSSGASENAFEMPVFSRYIISVKGPTMTTAVEETYDAQQGMNEKSNAPLLKIEQPGSYDISLFIHVQYIRPDGGNQILNKSAPSLTLSSP
jgi:hypothetical protein